MYKIQYKFYTRYGGETIRTDELSTTVQFNNLSNAKDMFESIMQQEHKPKDGFIYQWEIISLERIVDV